MEVVDSISLCVDSDSSKCNSNSTEEKHSTSHIKQEEQSASDNDNGNNCGNDSGDATATTSSGSESVSGKNDGSGNRGDNYINFKGKGFYPSKNDVIIGRGKKCYHHKGNAKLRHLVSTQLTAYSCSVTKSEKSGILCAIVKSIRNDPDGSGGFMKQDVKTQLYYDIGDIMAKEKISQTFRDCLQDTYKSSVMYKKKRRQEQNAEIMEIKRAKAASAAANAAAVANKNNQKGWKLHYDNFGMISNNLFSLPAARQQQFSVKDDIPSIILFQQQRQFQEQKKQFYHQNHLQNNMNNSSMLSTSTFDKIRTGEIYRLDNMMSSEFIKNLGRESDNLEELDISHVEQNGNGNVVGNGGYYNWLVSDFDNNGNNVEDDDELWGNDNHIDSNSSSNNARLEEQLEEIDLIGLVEGAGGNSSNIDYLIGNNNDNTLSSLENVFSSSAKEKCLSSNTNIMGRHQLFAAVATKKRKMMQTNDNKKSNNNKSRIILARMA